MTKLTAIITAGVALLCVGAPLRADCPANHTFVVTNVYDIDGVPGDALNLTVGYTYIFDLHNPSGHPFMLTADSLGGPTASPLPLSSGVSCVCQGCGTCTRRTITFTPAASLANTNVYYQCTVHYGLGNSIHVSPAPAITINTLPLPVSRCAGLDAQFTVSATSNETAIIGFQWLRNGQPVANTPGHIAGATSGTLTLTGATTADAGGYSCVLTAPCKTVTTAPATLTVTNCCPADLGIQGGAAGSDGHLDNNDFVAFIDLFFLGDARADRGRQGGVAGADGAFDNNDLIVFIDQFFAGC